MLGSYVIIYNIYMSLFNFIHYIQKRICIIWGITTFIRNSRCSVRKDSCNHVKEECTKHVWWLCAKESSLRTTSMNQTSGKTIAAMGEWMLKTYYKPHTGSVYQKTGIVRSLEVKHWGDQVCIWALAPLKEVYLCGNRILIEKHLFWLRGLYFQVQLYVFKEHLNMIHSSVHCRSDFYTRKIWQTSG